MARSGRRGGFIGARCSGPEHTRLPLVVSAHDSFLAASAMETGESFSTLLGGLHDASWGPCVVAGLGGVLAEAHADTAIRLAPVSEIDVSDMLESLPGQGKNSCSMSRKST